MTDDGSKVKPNFSVPTGNFGDILAGYYAKVRRGDKSQLKA